MCIRDSTLSKTDVAGPLWPSFCCSCCHCWTAVINKCALADVGERVFSQMFGMDFDMRELSRDCPQMCIEPGIFALVFPSRSDLAGRRTGVLFRTEGLAGKQVELALQMISGVVKIGFLVNVASGIIIDRQELESACQTLGIKLSLIHI